MSNSGNLVVADAEFTAAATSIAQYVNSLSAYMETYTSCLNTILENAIQDQAISAGIRSIATQVEALNMEMLKINYDIVTTCVSYSDAIDAADQFLY